MRKALQGDLLAGNDEHGPGRSRHGGDLRIGKRKIARPFKRNVPIHIVLKSTLATGHRSMRGPKNRLFIENTVTKHVSKCDAKLHSYENVGNHLHMLVSFKTKSALRRFLRAITGIIARHVLGAEKGRAAGKRFWNHLPFTRLIQGARDFAAVVRYIAKNTLEVQLGKAARESLEERERIEKKNRRRRSW